MLYRILGLLLVAVLLSIGLSVWFGVSVAAAVLFVATLIKKSLPALLILGRRFIANFFLQIIPRKLGTFMVKRGLISRKAQQKIDGHIALRKQQATKRFSPWLRLSFLLRATLLMVVMVGIMAMSVLWFDLWFLLVWLPHELETLLAPIWRSLVNMLANSTAFKLLNRLYTYLKNTYTGRLLARSAAWFDTHVTQRIEATGTAQRQRWLPWLDTWLENLPTVEIKQAKVPAERSNHPFKEQPSAADSTHWPIKPSKRTFFPGPRRKR